MIGGKRDKDEVRRLTPLAATILVLAAFCLEVVAWLWIAGPPVELPGRGETRVSVHLPPPPAPPPPAPAPAPEQRSEAYPPPAPPLPPMTEAQPVPVPLPEAQPAPEAAPAPPPSAAAPPAAPPPAPALPAPQPPAKAALPQLALVPVPPPRPAPEARPAWRVYAKPFDKNDHRPRTAVVIGNLGLSSAATEAAIQELPGGVTLAFSPYAHGLEDYIPLARAAGHEVLLSLPMAEAETEASAKNPASQALLTTVLPSDNLARLSWLLSRFTGYVGALNDLGTRVASADNDLRPILAELKDRGLLFLDSSGSGSGKAGRIALQLGLPAASTERIIDGEASRAAIDQMLDAVEEEARQKGASIAMGFPYPVTIERVAAWTATLPEKGISLAPVSAMVRGKGGS